MDYAIATELSHKEKAMQAATLKTVMGKECRQILARLELSTEYVKYLTVIIEKLESYLEPTQNILYECYLLHKAEQQPH